MLRHGWLSSFLNTPLSYHRTGARSRHPLHLKFNSLQDTPQFRSSRSPTAREQSPPYRAFSQRPKSTSMMRCQRTTVRASCWAIAAILLPAAGAAQSETTPSCTNAGVLNVSVTRGDRQLTVTWDAVQDATHYRVEWAPASDDGTTTAHVEGASHTITGLSNLIEYTVSVQADTTLACSTSTPPRFPSCPTDTLDMLVIAGDGGLVASWEDVFGVSDYELAWNPPAGDGRQTARVQNTFYSITNLQNGVEYTVLLGVDANNACHVKGTPAGPNGSDQNPVPAPAIPPAGLAGLALLLVGGGMSRRLLNLR